MIEKIKKFVETLPDDIGRISYGSPLSKVTWFQVGGPADAIFKPKNSEALKYFLEHKPKDIPLIPLGVGSNLLVRDGGIEGIVLKLGRDFCTIHHNENIITAGAGALDLNVALFSRENSIGGLEFLSGIPGTIGGALKMNAGAYGKEISDVLVTLKAIDHSGKIHILPKSEIVFHYRHTDLPDNWIFLSAELKGFKKDKQDIQNDILTIQNSRQTSQPIKSRTGGSTFKNPQDHKAWELIDQSGCRGLTNGNASVSEKHCNFLINNGQATASDIELLGEEVREKVLKKFGIPLEWEIKRIGRH